MMEILRIVLVARKIEGLARFAAGLWQDRRVELVHVDSAAEAMKLMQQQEPALVVVGEELSDIEPIDFVRQVVHLKPMINTALVSNLPAEAFHEHTEGLGVLKQLPVNPSGEDAESLLETLYALNAMLGVGCQKGERR